MILRCPDCGTTDVRVLAKPMVGKTVVRWLCQCVRCGEFEVPPPAEIDGQKRLL